jgi:hypothetical protein
MQLLHVVVKRRDSERSEDFVSPSEQPLGRGEVRMERKDWKIAGTERHVRKRAP